MFMKSTFTSFIPRGIAIACLFLSVASVGAESNDQSPDKTKVADAESRISWQPVTSELLEREASSGKNILLIVVADWCAPCQSYQETTLQSEAVIKLVNEKRVTAMVANITEPSAELKKMLKELEVRAIPTTFIFPAGRPEEKTRHVGSIPEDSLVNLLQKLTVSMRR